MLFCRSKYINSSADPINYRLSEYLMESGGGGGKSNGNINMIGGDSSTTIPSSSSLTPPELTDPEARSPLTPNDCDNRFLHLPEGIDLALHRAKLWSKYAKDLINYIDKRSNLGHKFIEPLAARRTEHEKIRKQIKSEWNRELKRTHESLTNLRKARIIYFQRNQEYERLRTLSNLSSELNTNEYGGPIGGGGGGGGGGVGGCYGGNDPVSKCERKKRIEDEACLRAQEAEIVYRNTINEANIRTRNCEELKRKLLIRIRELIYQCDQTLKAVTIGYFECQHNLYKPIVEQFGSLSDLTKLYQPGSKYADYISQLPEFTETLRKCNNNGILKNSDYNNKFDSLTNQMSTGKVIGNCNQRSTIKRSNNLNENHLKSCKDIELPVTFSSEMVVDGDSNFESGFNCSTLPATLTPSHHFRKLKTPSRCRHCDGYVCFQGLECINCGLTCHNKCRTELVIVNCSNNNNNNSTNLRRNRGSSTKKTMTTFGVDLKCSGDEIPPVLVKCINELDRRGSLIKGLYRVSGVKSRVEKLCQLFESCPVDSVDLNDVHPNVIANVLKLYLRQLPEPLITYKLYPEFIRIAKQYPSSADGSGADLDDPSIADQLVVQYKQLTSSLPSVHNKTLAFLCYHLKRVADQSKINNMPSSNLGIVFGPTLLRSSEGDSLSSLVDTGHQARVVQILITYVEKIFGPAPPSPQPLTDPSYPDDDEIDEDQQHPCENNENNKVNSMMTNTNRTQVTLTLEGNNCSSSKGKDKENDKLINKCRKMINSNNVYNNNMNDQMIIDHNNITIDGKVRSLERERLSPTPSIYSSSAVIKLSGQQIITGPSNLSGNYDDSDDRLNRSNNNHNHNCNHIIGGSRNSLYEARRQFFASPSHSPLSSLTSPSSSSSSPLSSSSTSSYSIRPHSLITGSMSLNSHNLNNHNHNHNHNHHNHSSPLSSTMSSPTTTTSSPSNELPSMTMSSLSLTRPRKASIVTNTINNNNNNLTSNNDLFITKMTS
ncbi:rho GTPase-activating protein 45-like isoform X2 [Panonychus citri]|uniref:rho GTPase-activating protein 45-like isoform X2 n=1 Tax=Panonychus citri TaxID=50023 RepID=UPI002308091B|nr:rho GTPase-activating protein 45-like isoform X2 [Panonychus citri]